MGAKVSCVIAKAGRGEMQRKKLEKHIEKLITPRRVYHVLRTVPLSRSNRRRVFDHFPDTDNKIAGDSVNHNRRGNDKLEGK